MNIDKENLLFNAADVIIKDKIFIFLSILIFVLIGFFYSSNFDKRDKSFSISTKVYLNHVQERQLEYLQSAFKLMTETNLDFTPKEGTEHNYDVYSYTISVVPPHLDHLKNLRHDLDLANSEDFPEIDIFPLIKQGNVSDDKITYFFTFSGGKIEDAINAVNQIIQKSEDNLNKEFRNVIDTYIKTYFFRYEIFQSAPIDKKIKLNEQLKNEIIMQLLDVTGYEKNSYNLLKLEASKLTVQLEDPIGTPRLLLASAFFGLVLSIIISLIKNSYREYRKKIN